MTRAQIAFLINVHAAQRDHAKKYLDKHYHELEEQNKETEWLNRYIFHKKIVEELEEEVPED